MSSDDFETFYESSFTRVYTAVYLACGAREVAWDATQEAFKRAFSRWPRLRREPWVGGWVMTTALNVYKKDARRSKLEAEFAESFRPPLSASIPIEQLDLWMGLRVLPIRQRQAIVLYYLEDLPVPVVAQLMDVAEGTVKAHLAQARKSLRNLMEVDDVR